MIRDTTQRMLEAVAKDAGYEALQKIAKDATDYDKMLNLVHERAADWAAEHVGKAVKDIEDSTRDMLRSSVEQAINEGMSTADLADLLADSYAFGDARAETIARTELAEANVMGTVEGYKQSGVVDGLTWLVSQDDVCDDCLGKLDKEGTLADGIEGEFPPLHPNCRCDVIPILSDEPEKLMRAGIMRPTVVQVDMEPMLKLIDTLALTNKTQIEELVQKFAKPVAPKNITFQYDNNGRVIGGTTEN